MSSRVLLVDTTMGNLRSVARALTRAGAQVEVDGAPEAIARADRVVVPGQGHFGDFARALDGGLGEALREHLRRARPYLGICLGMQALFESSEEAPGAAGLGCFAGTVRRIEPDRPDPDRSAHDRAGARLKVPHMGWNEVGWTDARLGALAGGEEGAGPGAGWYYFVHSYYCAPADASVTVGVCDYGGEICAAVRQGPIFACQFHPEKSQRAGARLLEAFVEDRWS